MLYLQNAQKTMKINEMATLQAILLEHISKMRDKILS